MLSVVFSRSGMTSLESTTLPQLESTVWPPCVLGFIWVAELSACVPRSSEFELSPGQRTYKTCPSGYYLHLRYNQCIREKFHGKQEQGKIRKWFESLRATPAPPPRGRKYVQKTTPYSGPWIAYGDSWGADFPRE